MRSGRNGPRLIGLVAVLVLGAAAAACEDDAAEQTAAAPPPAAASSAHAGHPPASRSPAVPLRAGERFVDLSMTRPYTPKPPSGGTDDYRCFLVDPQFREATFVTGSQFLPQQADIVHHAVFFRVDPADVAEARTLDDADAGDGWTCFGGSGVGARRGPGERLRAGGGWIAAWAPGGTENVLRPDTGYRLAAGSQIIMQVHYNLLATEGKADRSDQSAIRLRVTPGTAELKALQTRLLPAPVELPCAAGESGALCDRDASTLDVWRRFGEQAGATVAGLNLLCNQGKAPVAGPTQRCDHRLDRAGSIYAVAGHMHLLGRSIKVELNPGTPRARVLLDVPVYDFDDQGARPVAKPVPVKAGDMLRVTCTHDVALRRKLPELRTVAPRYVVWGEGTSDEMCLGIAVWAPAA